jgi:hypothetical protein
MLISDSTARALENVAARERDVLRTLPAQDSAADPFAAHIPCEAPPDAYFITRDESGRRLFMRCSALYLKGANLTDGNGRPLMGYAVHDGPLQPLRTDAVDASLGLAQNVRVDSDGTVTYDRSAIEPSTGARALQHLTIGRLALARFPAGTRLGGADDSYAPAPAGIAPHVGVPGDGGFPPLQSPLQSSGDGGLDSGLARLQEAYLALDALRAAGAAQGSVQKTVMDLLK